MLKVLSLFSGIGAFEKALDNLEVPYDLVAFCEFDKYASKSYCAIHGVDETKNLGDITKVDETKLAKDIDVLTYGFPCQDISLAGKQKGLFNEDGTQTRSGLFFEALRILEATKPKIAIAENVKNLTSKRFAEQFKIVLDSLEEAGYNNYWKVLNAKDYGVPQNRERVFIVSIRKDIDTGLFEFPVTFPLKKRLKDVLEDEVDEKYYLGTKGLELIRRHQSTRVNRTTKDADLTLVQLAHGFNPGCEMDADVFPTLTQGSAMHWHTLLCFKDGKILVSEANSSQQVVELPVAYDEQNRYVRKDGCVGTITTDGSSPKHNNRIIQEDLRIRKLTPKECFRLMGFDDESFHKAEEINSNRQLYKQAGNSIVVDVLEELFCMMLDEDGNLYV